MATQSTEKIFIILLNWNGWTHTRECLDSLERCTYKNLQVIVADNGSIDGCEAEVASKYQWVHFIQNGENLGFAEGNNRGITYALEQGADYVMLLNNDTVVTPGFIEPLLEAIKNGNDVVSPLIHYWSEPKKIWFAGSKIDWSTGWAFHSPANVEDVGQFTGISDVDYVSGCCLTAHAKTWRKIGLLDARYFAYYEDVDWSVRATKSGYSLKLVADSTIWHKVSQSSAGATGIFLFVRNGLLFISRHISHNRMPVYLKFLEQWVFRPILREIKGSRYSSAKIDARARAVLAHLRKEYGAPPSRSSRTDRDRSTAQKPVQIAVRTNDTELCKR